MAKTRSRNTNSIVYATVIRSKISLYSLEHSVDITLTGGVSVSKYVAPSVYCTGLTIIRKIITRSGKQDISSIKKKR